MPQCPTCDSRYPAGARFCPLDGSALQATVETPTAPGADELIGRVLDERYRLDERIGSGGMGAVYRGRHLLMNRAVAIKVLRADVAPGDKVERRFEREARQCALLDHPGCIRVMDFGHSADGLRYLVMDYIAGTTLGELVHFDGPLPPRRAAHIAAQAARALAHAHDRGVMHRDLKPDNIMVFERDGDRDAVKLLDFGLSKLLERPQPATGETQWSLASLTESGMVYGTPEFMSPEQASGNAVDARTDLYSLGLVLYHMLSGELPFQGNTFMEILAQHVTAEPESVRTRCPERAIPAELDAIVSRCLAKAPDDRPASARALADSLEALLPELPAPASRVDRQVAAAATMDLGSEAPTPATSSRPAVPAAAPVAAARGRAPWAWLAAALVAACAALAIAAWPRSGTERAARPAPPAAAVPPASHELAAKPAPASPTTSAMRDAAPPEPTRTDPGRAAPTDRVGVAAPPASPPRAARPRRSDTALERHLAAAERARAAGNALKQQAEADLALRRDPGSARAAFLLGDALLRAGDPTGGCAYLARAGSIARARQLRSRHCRSGDED